MTLERFLEAGRVGRAHGLDGSFHVTSPRPRLLMLGMPTDLGEIVRRVGTDERPVVRLAGCETREAAEALHAQPLRVALADAPGSTPASGGRTSSRAWRSPTATARSGPCGGCSSCPRVEVLEVECADGTELLVPMVGDAIRTLDVPGRRVDVDLEFLDAD